MNRSEYTLQTIVERYEARFKERYGASLNNDQWSALNAIQGCRQGQYGDVHTACSSCPHRQDLPRSCGHRSCNQCQLNSTQAWLDRQRSKQLPVDYYMATFTLPPELRDCAKRHQKTVYRLLLECASHTLKTFGFNKRRFEAEIGMCAVLHTHTRKLDYHPHVHIVIPGGGVNEKRKEWRKLKGDYLFNGYALAQVFKGTLLRALNEAGLGRHSTPKKWVVQCQKVGRGKEALQYLSRYLYRGVIANKNILHDDGNDVTFQYVDSGTKRWSTRTVAGETFLYLLSQHVLPKGFRRARDYGFLHGNAKKRLILIQWILKVQIEAGIEIKSVAKHMRCPKCNATMNVLGIRQPKPG